MMASIYFLILSYSVADSKDYYFPAQGILKIGSAPFIHSISTSKTL